MGIRLPDSVQNIVEKEENCTLGAISSFPTMFSKLSVVDALK